jgi:hypothetical protein
MRNHVTLDGLGRPPLDRRLIVNRHERRAAAAHERRWKDKTAEVGTVIKTQSLSGSDGMHYWFEMPEGWTREDGMPEGVDIHGPFKTAAEADENERLVLLGPQCKVTEGGEWDPAWDRMQ